MKKTLENAVVGDVVAFFYTSNHVAPKKGTIVKVGVRTVAEEGETK